MAASWNIGGLLSDLRSRGGHPAVIAFGVEGSEIWDSATIADKALSLAHGLRDTPIGAGGRVALWASNSPGLDRRSPRRPDGRRSGGADR